MYYELEEITADKYDDGQMLYYTPNNNIWSDKPSIIIVEKKDGYSAKIPGMPTVEGIDSHYINGRVRDNEVFPISEDSHPEIFIKFGFRA
jgi:hypothetical protein